MLQALIYFFAALVFGGILITGWFAVTRGRWETLPDGTKYWTGKLFNFWQKFWESTSGTKDIYFANDELKKLVLQMMPVLGFSLTNGNAIDANCLILNRATFNDVRSKFWVFEVQNKVFALFKHGDENKSYIFFYKQVPKYRFPEWVRDPLASCIYCHSSIYGTLIWWFLAIISIAFFQSFPIGYYLFMWIPYMISLSFVSPYLWKKL